MGWTRIQERCPVHGDLSLVPGLFRLVVHPHRHELDFYEFMCPTCNESYSRPASRVVKGLLLAAGVEQVTVRPPLTEQDAIDFALALWSTDRLAAVAAVGMGDDDPRRKFPKS